MSTYSLCRGGLSFGDKLAVPVCKICIMSSIFRLVKSTAPRYTWIITQEELENQTDGKAKLN